MPGRGPAAASPGRPRTPGRNGFAGAGGRERRAEEEGAPAGAGVVVLTSHGYGCARARP